MRIYQILLTHNRPWTSREIAVFGILLIVAAVVLGRLVKVKRITCGQAIASLLLLAFLAVVFASTVFTRNPGIRRYELAVFWSWRRAMNGEWELLRDNVLNLLLLFPAGILLSFAAGRRTAWWKGLLFGLAVSAAIEVLQLVLCRGLFEWDDMIHNAVGCMTGTAVAGWIRRLFQ